MCLCMCFLLVSAVGFVSLGLVVVAVGDMYCGKKPGGGRQVGTARKFGGCLTLGYLFRGLWDPSWRAQIHVLFTSLVLPPSLPQAHRKQRKQKTKTQK